MGYPCCYKCVLHFFSFSLFWNPLIYLLVHLYIQASNIFKAHLLSPLGKNSSITSHQCKWNPCKQIQCRRDQRASKCDGSKWFSTTSTASATITTTIHGTQCHIYSIHYTYTFYLLLRMLSKHQKYPSLKWGISKQGTVAVMSLILVNCHVLLKTTEKLALKARLVLSLQTQACLCHMSSKTPILSPADLLSL